MKKLTVRIEKEMDALWALPAIATKIVEGYKAGDYHGAKWWIEDEKG